MSNNSETVEILTKICGKQRRKRWKKETKQSWMDKVNYKKYLEEERQNRIRKNKQVKSRNLYVINSSREIYVSPKHNRQPGGRQMGGQSSFATLKY